MHARDAKATAAERRTEYEAWYEEQVRLGLEDCDAGRVVNDEEVRKHFEKRFKQHAERQKKQAACLVGIERSSCNQRRLPWDGAKSLSWQCS